MPGELPLDESIEGLELYAARDSFPNEMPRDRTVAELQDRRQQPPGDTAGRGTQLLGLQIEHEARQ